MEFSDFIKFLPYIFIIVYMLSVGLETKHGEIMSYFKSSGLAPNALLANLVLVPIVGWLLTIFIPVSEETRIGLLLLAIAPGGLFALNFARVSKGNLELAVALLLLLSLIGIIVTPILSYFFFGGVGSAGRTYRLISILTVLILIPIYSGRFLAKHLSVAVAKKLSRWLGTTSVILFVVSNLLTSKDRTPALKSIEFGGITIIVLLVIASWVIGWLLGGREVHNKIVMAISTSMRNVGVCMPIAINDFPATNVIVPILAFSGISIPMNFLFVLATKFLLHKRPHLAHQEKPIAPKL